VFFLNDCKKLKCIEKIGKKTTRTIQF